jgi:hypothetical protein
MVAPSDSRRPTAVRYAILIYDSETANPNPAPRDPEVRAATTASYNDYTAMLKDRGAYLGGEALHSVTMATTVRVQDGETVTTDGPFAETKEALGGFYLIEAKDLDEALELAATCPGVRYGSIEVRPVVDFAAPA